MLAERVDIPERAGDAVGPSPPVPKQKDCREANRLGLEAYGIEASYGESRPKRGFPQGSVTSTCPIAATGMLFPFTSYTLSLSCERDICGVRVCARESSNGNDA